MKRIFFLFVVITAISCTKENVSTSIVGNWFIIERAVGTGSGYSPAPIASQRTLHFNTDGTFRAEDSDSSNILQGFNQYSVQPDQKILLTNTTSGETLSMAFSLDNNLQLYYPARCGLYERFTRK